MSETPPSLFCLIAEGTVPTLTTDVLLQRPQTPLTLRTAYPEEETFAIMALSLRTADRFLEATR